MNLEYPDPSKLKSMKKIKGRFFVDGKQVTYSAMRPRGQVIAVSEIHRRLAMLPQEFTIKEARHALKCNSEPAAYGKLKRLKDDGFISTKEGRDNKLIVYFKTDKCGG